MSSKEPSLLLQIKQCLWTSADTQGTSIICVAESVSKGDCKSILPGLNKQNWLEWVVQVEGALVKDLLFASCCCWTLKFWKLNQPSICERNENKEDQGSTRTEMVFYFWPDISAHDVLVRAISVACIWEKTVGKVHQKHLIWWLECLVFRWNWKKFKMLKKSKVSQALLKF